jgi:hypothetical protein
MTGVVLACFIFSPPRAQAGDCIESLLAAEVSLSIPRGLLVAAALARRFGAAEPDGGLSPWTVTVRKGDRIRIRVHDDENAALEDLKARRAGRAPELRLGCVMLLWRAHRGYFQGPGGFLDVDRSALYFARYIARLKRRLGNWTKAVGHSWSEHGWKQRIHACETAHQYARLLGRPAPKCELR